MNDTNTAHETPPQEGERPPRSKRNPVVGSLIIVIILLAAAASVTALVFLLPPKAEDVEPNDAVSVNVEIEVVEPVPVLPDSFEQIAVIEPNRVVEVSAEVDGRIDAIHHAEGTTCEAGDPLVSLNTDLLTAEYHRAVAQQELDQKQFERVEKLLASNVASREEYDQAAAQLAVSRASVESAKARLERAEIIAPIGGILDSVPVEMGEYVVPGTTVAEIVEVDTVKVVAYVSERDIPFFRAGDTADILTDHPANSKHTLSGPITYISELADEDTRATRMEITLDNRKRILRSGQIVRVRLTRRTLENAILIPLLAVIPSEKGYVVYVVEDDAAQPRTVELGLLKGRQVQVLSGLRPGDRLIVAGHRFVGPGQSVTIIPKD